LVDFYKILSSETALTNESKLKEASYHVLVHLAKCFQRGRFLKIDPSETIIAYGGHIC
jgi:hypothetical protein